jgi:hypothetical protein
VGLNTPPVIADLVADSYLQVQAAYPRAGRARGVRLASDCTHRHGSSLSAAVGRRLERYLAGRSRAEVVLWAERNGWSHRVMEHPLLYSADKKPELHLIGDQRTVVSWIPFSEIVPVLGPILMDLTFQTFTTCDGSWLVEVTFSPSDRAENFRAVLEQGCRITLP